MELVTFSEIEPFKKNLEPFLLNSEALNSILIGTLLQANEAAILSLGTCCQGSKLEIAWMLTHDKVLMLTEGSEKALHLLADHFSKQPQDIYRIRGAAYSVDTFIRLSRLGNCKSMMQNVYQLDKKVLQNQTPGQLRKAELSDTTYLQSWVEKYITEAKLDPVDPNGLLKTLIGKERLYLWENNKIILSMAACAGPTFTGIRINLVFTPQDYRGKGYASSCVAELANHLLEHGYSKCFIFADQENHTANTIYKKMGFALMGSYMDCKIAKDTEAS
ncbi:MAG: GNAT family N-acetyltransferase [Parachlamydiales bacterium]